MEEYRMEMPYTNERAAPTSLDSSLLPNVANVLQGIAHLGMVSSTIVQQLWLPHRSQERSRALLRHLACQGLITPHYHYRSQEGRPPRRAGCWWTLTRKGIEWAQHLSGEDELKTPGVRTLLLQHDGMLVNACAAIIAQARRQALSSVVVRREVSLIKGALKPKPDGLLILRHTPGCIPQPNSVPWANVARPEEHAQWLALEADNDTEDRATIIAKAEVYRDTWQLWQQHGRAVPRVCWVAPTAKRRDWIHALWQQVWPQGTWLSATTDEVEQGVWWQYRQGEMLAVYVFG